MATNVINLVRGDAAQYDLTITGADDAPVDLTGAVVKFAAKRSKLDANSAAVIFKASYDPAEVAFTTASAGLASVYVKPDDTLGEVEGQLHWEVEVTEQGDAVAGVGGTLAVTVGSGVMTFTGSDLSLVKPGMIVVPAGATAPNQKPVTVVSVDEDANTAVTDYTGWAAESGVAFTVREGNRHTPAAGALNLTADVVL